MCFCLCIKINVVKLCRHFLHLCEIVSCELFSSIILLDKMPFTLPFVGLDMSDCKM